MFQACFFLLFLPLQSAYKSLKFAVKGFTESLKIEMAGSNVSVHCIQPGDIKTHMTNNAKTPSVQVSKSQILADFNKQAADIILKAMSKNKWRILLSGDAKLLIE